MGEERVDRRLAAIFAGDIAGYSRLMGADEEGTLRQLNSHRNELVDPKITEHRGRIVKTTGDGMLVEFVSVVDAVRCAVDIQRGMAERNGDVPADKRIAFRIGINVGDIIAKEGDVFGDGVNIAARLEQLAEPGGICISHAAFEQVRDKLAFEFEDCGFQSVKNITRPIRIYRLSQRGQLTSSVSIPSSRRDRRRLLVGGSLAILCACVAAAAAWTLWPDARSGDTANTSARNAAPSPNAARLRAMGRAPVAVLPFKNLNAKTNEEYFGDGLTEEVTDGLSRYSGLSVVAFAAAASFKNASEKPDSVARILGVRYLVSGSVRRVDKRLRILVRLVDAESDRLVWTQQFESDADAVIALQDEITRRIVGALEIRVTQVELERVRRKPPDSLEAHDLVMRGRAAVANPGRGANVEARALFQRAIAIDPAYADAYAELARSYRIAVDQGWTANPSETLRLAEVSARKSIALDDRNSRAYAMLGRILVMRREFDLATSAAKRALELNPSDSDGFWSLGTVLLYSGSIAAAIDALETARAYNPTPNEYTTLSLALAYYVAGRFRDCVRFVEGSVGRDAEHRFSYYVLAMAYAQLGETDEARTVASIARRRNPIFEARTFGSLFRDAKYQASIREGLAKIGLR